MLDRLLAPLLETLRPHFDLSKTRLETLAVLLVGLANCRTVNLSHLASPFPGDARHASNYRRLQRFFQHIRLDGDIGARLADREFIKRHAFNLRQGKGVTLQDISMVWALRHKPMIQAYGGTL